MSGNGITWVGLDAHKKSIHVAMLVPGREDALSWQEANEEGAVRRLARKLTREAPGGGLWATPCNASWRLKG